MLNDAEKRCVDRIADDETMQPILKRLAFYVSQYDFRLALDCFYQDLSEEEFSIENMISVVIFWFLKIKEAETKYDDLFISAGSDATIIERIGLINVGESKPTLDVDIVIYKENDEKQITSCLLLIVMDSSNARLEQLCFWKVLLDVFILDSSLRNKYVISCDSVEMPVVCFATINFYDEINSPQHRGMLKFFDNSFIGKPVDSEFISRLSALIDYANEKLSP